MPAGVIAEVTGRLAVGDGQNDALFLGILVVLFSAIAWRISRTIKG